MQNKDRYFTFIAYVNFKTTIKSANVLLGLYKIRKDIPMPNKNNLEEPDAKISHEDAKVLLKSALIIIVTAIEGYIEYVVERFFEYKLKIASTPKDVEKAFNSAYASWCENKNNNSNNPDDMKVWTGTGWKKLLLKKCENDIERFNTPNSKNINKLFKRYCAISDIISQCKMQDMSSKEAKETLDGIIKKRGKAVHKGKEIFEPYDNISFSEAMVFICFSETLIIRLNEIIEEKGKEFRKAHGSD